MTTWTAVHEQVADVVDRHEPDPDTVHGCTCGWDNPQHTFGEHVAQVLADLGLLATTTPTCT